MFKGRDKGMRSTLAFALTVPVVLASLLLASCATDPFVTGSVAKRQHKRANVAYRAVPERAATASAKSQETNSVAATTPATNTSAPAAPVAVAPVPAAPAEVTSKEDPRWQWCEQRHLDHQAGRAPAGAQDLEQKLRDDRTCAAIYAERAGNQEPAAQAPEPIDTGSITGP
jgi:hypothetical protein